MKTAKLLTFSTLLALALIAASCASVKQSVVFTPIERGLTVSASAALRVDGLSLLPDSYEVIDAFSFERKLKQPISGKGLLPLDLNGELAALRASSGGDAIVNLRFHLLRVDTAAVHYIALERFVGLVGIGTMAFGAFGTTSESEGSDGSGSMTGMILSGGAIAALGFGGAQLHKALGSIEYRYLVEGDIVRFK